jgi:hypothetical protein
MPTTATPADSAARAYRFQRFRTALLLGDMTFGPDAPGPGDQVPATGRTGPTTNAACAAPFPPAPGDEPRPGTAAGR